jgi:hypothetical protein
MIRLAIGIMIGAAAVAYYPEAGRELRSATNAVAGEVESRTAPTVWERYEDLEQEVIDELRK